MWLYLIQMHLAYSTLTTTAFQNNPYYKCSILTVCIAVSALMRSQEAKGTSRREKWIVPETRAGSGILLGYLWDIKSDMKMWSNGWDRARDECLIEQRLPRRGWGLMPGCCIRENKSKQQTNTEQSNRQTRKDGEWGTTNENEWGMRKWSGGGGVVRCEETRGEARGRLRVRVMEGRT